MDKKETPKRPVNPPGIDRAAHPEPSLDDGKLLPPDRSLDEIVSALKAQNTVRDKLSRRGDAYEIETVLQVNDREWYFLATVRHNGNEISDDIELAPDELRRKRATQANKSKALWNLFVKEAAATHLEKCSCVNRRLENVNLRRWHNPKYVLPVLGGLIAALAGTGIYLWQVTTPPAVPTVQTMPAATGTTEKTTLMIDVRSAKVPLDTQTLEPVTTAAPTQPPRPAQDGQAQNELEPISPPQQPLPSATQSDIVSERAENQSPMPERQEQPAAMSKAGPATPEPEGRPTATSQNAKEPLMKGRKTPEPLRQQAAPQLSPEEIKQQVRKLLNDTQ